MAQPSTLQSKFSSIPVELHNLILEELDVEDVLSLSLVNQYFWNLAQRPIRTYLMSFVGGWAGQSIICVGDYLLHGDFPDDYPEDNKKEIERQYKVHLEEVGLREDEDEVEPISLYNLSTTYLYTETRAKFPEEALKQLLDMKQESGMPLCGVQRLGRVVTPKLSELYPEDQLWILRNLTKKVYVRSDAIASKPEDIHGPIIDGLGFGEVLVSRICWSSDPSVSFSWKGPIYRGAWAGHCFDITTLARLEREDEKGEWRDVSEEVAEEVAEMFESDLGSSWRELLKIWK